jgi:hypothetical protein
MKYLVIFLFLFLLLTLQAGFVSNLGLGTIGNLCLLFAISSVILGDFEESFFTCIAAGFMIDLVSASRAGIITICFLAVFGFTYIFTNKFVQREASRLILFILALANTLLFSLIFLIVNHFLNYIHLGTMVDWKYILGKKLFVDLIFNIILIYPVFMLYAWMQKIQRKLPKFI